MTDEDFDEEVAAAELLRDGVLHVGHHEDHISLYVVCNDVFGYACADGEEVPPTELERLYRMHQTDNVWGCIQWCVLRRKRRPIQPVVDAMGAAGAWTTEMEEMPDDHSRSILRQKTSAP